MRLLSLLPAILLWGCASSQLDPGRKDRSASQSVVVDAHGNVLRFYGVPIDLAISTMHKLPFQLEVGEEMDEGLPYPVVQMTAENGVEIKVVFDESGPDGNLYTAVTTSPNAVGPRGIGVGSTLSNVKAAWPGGRLDYGLAHGKYVTFITGANVYYQFSPADMPPQAFDVGSAEVAIPDMRVRAIRLMRLRQE